MEVNARSLIKTASWRVFAIIITFVIIYLYSGKPLESTVLTVVINGTKTLCFFLHERFWTRIGWGYEMERPRGDENGFERTGKP